ncbi:hypothetical protein E6P70_01330 [Moraxella nonliquefaciens]|uniref:hypothetical protein n=1 Tax=Moraxella nonliquefaciens TaxID=478 RepID=UPI0024A75310|nr:hypothetical protein [Moraxella nonliquefaciens]MDI4497339.1 hypothetical protein [Moraxella nonliquefaciens]MDI4499274.1 hypothetical protein [Moraxella nonliquefaciens]
MFDLFSNMFDLFMNLPNETKFFIVVILLFTIIFHYYYGREISEKAPTFLTTLGIFATFFAIAMGLLEFNASNITNSVPALLESMKTAFWASVFGVGCALTFKFRDIFFPNEEFSDNEEFHQILIEELRGLREENKELLEQSIKSQNEALSKIAKSSSEELVKALQDVIKDFNAKINEQFGENFKQLNQAVEKIVVWQKQYTDYIDTSTNSLNQLIENIEKSTNKLNSVIEQSNVITNNFNHIVENSKNFVDVSKNLEITLGNLNTQRQAIQTQLTTLSTLVVQASDDLPKIGSQILNIATTMQNSSDEFNRKVINLTENTEKQTNALNKGIEDALTQSLTTLGGQLGAMTEKFASDYNALSNALAKISQITKQGGR